MTRRQDQGVAEIEAEMRAEMDRLQADPKAAAALHALGEQQALRDPLPLPQTLIDDAVEEMEKRQARERVRTQPNAVAPALAGVRPVTRRLAVDVTTPEPARVEKVMVEGMRELPTAGAHEETNVGGAAVVIGEDVGSDGNDIAGSTSRPRQSYWLVALVVAALVAGVIVLIWKSVSGPAEGTATTATTSPPRGSQTSPSSRPLPALSLSNTSPTAPSTGATTAESSAPAVPSTSPRPTSTVPIVAPVPSSHPSTPPTSSSSATPPASSGPAIIKIHG